MTITIVGGGNPSGPTFPVQRSVRLRSSASAYFNRTPASNGNRTTWTFSCWVKRAKLGVAQDLLSYYASGINETIQITAADQILRYCVDTSGTVNRVLITTNSVLRDPSSWYHIVVTEDTTQATDTNRIKIYVNGVQQTTTNTVLPVLNWQSYINSTVSTSLGGTQGYTDGYLTEINFIDGQALTPTSFGAYNSYGVWSPSKYSGSYGTNGFYLNFQDNSAATATTIGKDSSGNGNNWTPNNISVTAGVTYDSMLDVPTLTSATNANFATLNPLRQNGSGTFSQGNLAGASESSTQRGLCSSIVLPRSGKWYMEWTPTSNTFNWFGVTANEILAADINTAGQQSVLYYASNGNKYVNGTASAYGTSYTTQTIGIAFDGPAGTITFYRDNVSQGAITLPSSTVDYVFCMGNAASGGIINYANFGQRPFTYTPPTGFVALNTYNLPAPTIPNGAAQMAASLYTGTGAALSVANTVNGVSFQPDFVWLKGRSVVSNHAALDSVRPSGFALYPNLTDAEGNNSTLFTGITSNGFNLAGTNVTYNQAAATYVGWQWKANGTPAVTNTSGSVPSTISANTTAGFSIVTYTGTGANATVGHGLGVAPRMIIVKNRTAGGAGYWLTWHSNMTSASYYLALNLTIAQTLDATVWNSTAPTSSVFSIGTNTTSNNSGTNFVAYCWAEIPGFSKFGSYTGNGSTDGPFVYLGFRPRFILIKTSNDTYNWVIYDTSRETYNVMSNILLPNSSGAEQTNSLWNFDVLSNGFKCRGANGNINGSANTYIYACFAENPFNYSLAR